MYRLVSSSIGAPPGGSTRTTRRRFFRGLAATVAAGLLPESANLAGEAPPARRAARLADLPREDRARLAVDAGRELPRELRALLSAPPGR